MQNDPGKMSGKILEPPNSEEGIMTSQTETAADRPASALNDAWQRCFDAMQDMAVILDRDNRIIDVNAKVLAERGVRKEEVLGHRCYEILYQADMPPESCPHHKFMATGGKDVAEEEFEVSGRVFSVSITPLRDGHGQLIQSLHIFKDITKRKQAERELKRSEELYRTLVENIDLGITLIDSEHTVLMANEAQGRLFQKSPQTFIGRKCFREFEKREQGCPHCLGPLAMETGVPQEFETAGVRDDGSQIDVRIRAFPVRDENGVARSFIEVVEDITGRKSTEKKLRQSNEILERIFSLPEFCLAYLDAQLNFVRVNPAYAETGGHDPDFYIGKKHFDLYPHEENEAIFRSVIETGQSFTTQAKPFSYPDQSERGITYWDWTLCPMSGEKGKVEGLLLVLVNVTDRTLSEERLRQAQKQQAIGTLAGGIAHDYNNILTAIIGYAQLALMDLPSESKSAADINEVLKAGNRAKELVQQILTFSRQAETVLVPTRLQLIIKEALKLLRASLPSTVEIRAEINENCRSVMADPTQIHQILMNLCTNAYHAMQVRGGVMSVRLCEVASGDLEAAVARNLEPGSYLMIEVQDSGIGMEQETLSRVFEPYFTTKEKSGGTGLGLAVVHGIVARHHGHIDLQSSPGQGTTVRIFLPLIETDAEAPAREFLDAVSGGMEHILLVDDEEQIVSMEQRALERFGYKVTAFQDSCEALDCFCKNPEIFNLVITDMTMPKKTGAQLAKEILSQRSDLPIILLSGFSEEINEEKAKTIGVERFIMKPVNPKDLAAVVREILDKRSPRAAGVKDRSLGS